MGTDEQLSILPGLSLKAALEQARQIVCDATAEHQPLKTYILFSGGDDSLVMLSIFGDLADGVVFVNTGTGIPETSTFVRETVASSGLPLHELHPPKSYEEVFIDDAIIDGLPGPGMHRVAYSRLKERALRAFRNGHGLKHKERIMFLTGIRHDESAKRMGYGGSVVDREGRIVWVNPIYWLTQKQRNNYIASNGIERNPVSVNLHISGECLCGCFARPDEMEEIAFFYPDHAAWLRSLEAKAEAKGLTYCQWGQRRGKSDEAGRLCSTCIAGQELLDLADGSSAPAAS